MYGLWGHGGYAMTPYCWGKECFQIIVFMMRIVFYVFVFFLLSCSSDTYVADKVYNRGINIIPAPYSLEKKTGKFEIGSSAGIFCANEEWKEAVTSFTAKVSNVYGTNFIAEKKKEVADFLFLEDVSLAEEEYTIRVSEKQVVVKASTTKGVFYAVQTLLQLLPAEIEGEGRIADNFSLPLVDIHDKPMLQYRGVMIDVNRHFFSVEELKKQIRVMAMLKLNYLHLHLTDNHGWRLQIERYPELVETAAVAETYNGKKYGPYYYTKKEMREIIDFAGKYHIEVVPEIEFPGHCISVLASHPELSCFGQKFESEQVFNYSEAVFCIGNEQVFTVMQNILKEVAELFPCKYLHIGGDECAKTYWKKCPKCQSLAKQLQLVATEEYTVEEQLQNYAIRRMGQFIADSLGKQMIGWDEIIQGGVPQNATVMSWRGLQGGITAAGKGCDVIMAPMPEGLYLCDYQGAIEVEPAASGLFAYLKDVYDYNPVPESLPVDKRKHIVGVQCCAWSEWTSGVENLERVLYPRVIALAETAWTLPEHKRWESFLKRLDNMQVRLDMRGVNYHIPNPEGVLTTNKIMTGDSVTLHFTNSRNLPMVYTLDGTEPSASSLVMPDTLTLYNPATLKIAVLLADGKTGKTRVVTVEKLKPCKALDKECDTKVRLRIADGLFCTEDDYPSARFHKDTVITSLSAYNKDKFDFKKPGLAEYTGEFSVPSTGVYTFSSNADELWIAGKRLVYNPTSSRFYAQKTEVYLEKGVHPYKLLFSNRLKEGFASSWYSIDFKYTGPGGETVVFCDE